MPTGKPGRLNRIWRVMQSSAWQPSLQKSTTMALSKRISVCIPPSFPPEIGMLLSFKGCYIFRLLQRKHPICWVNLMLKSYISYPLSGLGLTKCIGCDKIREYSERKGGMGACPGIAGRHGCGRWRG